MIPTKVRESRRVKALKLPKNLERLYKEGKCRECAVVVTRMDFAKILGKFTKVKIQYESSTTPKTKLNPDITPPSSNARLKSNENGMVLMHKNTYNERPFKDLQSTKNAKKSGSSVAPNILRENNRLKKPSKVKNTVLNDQKQKSDTKFKQYGIIFEDPLTNNNNNNEINFKLSLIDLLPKINDSILPTDEWCIDYFPKKDEPKDDQVYDRIAAELEDLMYNEKPIAKLDEKQDTTENKVDDFPSIMDILNDNSSESKSNDQSSTLEFKSNLESSDVEAMLLGKPNPADETEAPQPMEVDNTNMGQLIEDVNHLSTIQETLTNNEETGNSNEDILPKTDITDEIENPHSPSILDEALQKGIEEHIPVKQTEPSLEGNTEEEQTNDGVKEKNNSIVETEMKENEVTETEIKVMETNVDNENSESNDNIKSKDINLLAFKDSITHVVFKKTKGGICSKSVTCPKNLKYCIEIEDKSVEFIGAPKFITSLEDLQVLLQIVNESELDSLYVLH
ncbi:hypothetical protein PYW08_011757 [Mythimna loreyi]|uniref:Uncharacterized protein n=1 Tax=Mythimna loreyi TaxID=667449 RepID=A0ACC2QKQ2_9NEOP|nr:hypothetical protein PYW08_011757 [Mythimna loreyi]